jgi:hypothetical protein
MYSYMYLLITTGSNHPVQLGDGDTEKGERRDRQVADDGIFLCTSTLDIKHFSNSISFNINALIIDDNILYFYKSNQKTEVLSISCNGYVFHSCMYWISLSISIRHQYILLIF